MKNKSSVQPVKKIRKSNKAAEKNLAKVELTFSPKFKEYIETKVKSGLYEDIGDVVRDALRALHSKEISSPLINVETGDIEALVTIVLMQAANEANEDLKLILAEVKAANDAKRKIRDRLVKKTGKIEIDPCSELMEMSMLRMQMIMDRLSKFISVVSNLLKRISKTSESLIQNIK